jgi:hypothetical protein
MRADEGPLVLCPGDFTPAQLCRELIRGLNGRGEMPRRLLVAFRYDTGEVRQDAAAGSSTTVWV